MLRAGWVFGIYEPDGVKQCVWWRLRHGWFSWNKGLGEPLLPSLSGGRGEPAHSAPQGRTLRASRPARRSSIYSGSLARWERRQEGVSKERPIQFIGAQPPGPAAAKEAGSFRVRHVGMRIVCSFSTVLLRNEISCDSAVRLVRFSSTTSSREHEQ